MSSLIEGPAIVALSVDEPDELVDGDDDESCSVAVTFSTVMAKPSYQPVLLITRSAVVTSLDEVADGDAAAVPELAAAVAEDADEAVVAGPRWAHPATRATTDTLAAAIRIAFDVI